MNRKLQIFHFSFLCINRKRKEKNNKRGFTETTENATVYENWNSRTTPATCGLVVHSAKAKHIRGLYSNESSKKLLRLKESSRLQQNPSWKAQHVQVLWGCSALVILFSWRPNTDMKNSYHQEKRNGLLMLYENVICRDKTKCIIGRKPMIFFLLAFQKWIFSNQINFKWAYFDFFFKPFFNQNTIFLVPHKMMWLVKIQRKWRLDNSKRLISNKHLPSLRL